MPDIKEKPKVDDPLGPRHRCLDFDEDCEGVPDRTVFRTHLSCWLYAPERGWCPFLKGASDK